MAKNDILKILWDLLLKITLQNSHQAK